MSMSGGLSKPAARAAVSNFSYRRHEVDVATGGLDVWAISSQVRVGSASLRRAVSLTASGRSDVAMNHSSSACSAAFSFDGSGSTEDLVCSEGLGCGARSGASCVSATPREGWAPTAVSLRMTTLCVATVPTPAAALSISIL